MTSFYPRPLPTSSVDDPNATPQQREAAKSRHKRAEDIAYVLNHTGTCLFFDLTGGPPAMSALAMDQIRRFSGKAVPTGRGFGGWFKDLAKNGKEWWIGEVVGDLGAVPVTILTQRFAPGFIDKLGRGAETILRPAYQWGARHSTASWAKEHGIAPGSDEYKAHERHIYRSETQHLGDAVEWTLTAFPLNIAAQKWRNPEAETMEILGGKLAGALWATGAVLATRAVMPEAAQRLDHKTSEHVILPVTRTVGRLFGVDAQTIDAAARSGRHDIPDTQVHHARARERMHETSSHGIATPGC